MKPETRKEIEAFIIKYVNKVDPSGENGKFYAERFKEMADKDLEKLIQNRLPIFMPNGWKVKIDHYKNIEIARELGYEFRQHLFLTDPRTGVCAKTRYKHMMLELPVRRQSQMIDKKISIPEHSRTIDKTTGQVVGPSKGSSFSFPQTYVLYGKGYDATLREFLVARGGDIKAGQVIDRNIRTTGHSSLNFEGSDRTRVKSTQTTGVIFQSMHLGSNLIRG